MSQHRTPRIHNNKSWPRFTISISYVYVINSKFYNWLTKLYELNPSQNIQESLRFLTPRLACSARIKHEIPKRKRTAAHMEARQSSCSLVLHSNWKPTKTGRICQAYNTRAMNEAPPHGEGSDHSKTKITTWTYTCACMIHRLVPKELIYRYVEGNVQV